MKYNIIENLDNYVIEIMATGFNKQEIEIREDGNKLIVVAEKPYKNDCKYKVKQFNLDNSSVEIELEKAFEITQAKMVDGLLVIFADKKEKTRKIEIE